MRHPTYTRLHQAAQRMVEKYGAACTVKRTVSQPVGPGELPLPDVKQTVYSGPAVILPNNSELRKVFDALTGGPTVQVGETNAYLSPADGSIEFKITDSLAVGNTVYAVKNGVTYNPDGQGIILHILELQQMAKT